MAADFKVAWPTLDQDVTDADYPTTYHQSTRRGRELDAMSITEYLDEAIPGGASSRLGQLLDIAYTIEYGADSAVQSSLNLLYLLGYSGPKLRIFGESDERFHVSGGNDQVPAALADELRRRHHVRVGARCGDRTLRRRVLARLPRARQDDDGVGGQGRPCAPVLDHPALGGHLACRLLESKADRDRGAGHGDELEAPRPVRPQALARPRLERRDLLPTRATRTPGR